MVDFGVGNATGNVINIGGNFTKFLNGSFGTTSTSGATGFVFNGGGQQTLSYAGTNSEGVSYTVLAGSTLKLQSDLTIGSSSGTTASSFTVNGTLDAVTFTIGGGAGNGTFTLNSGATLKTSNFDGVVNSTTGSISNTINTRTFSSAANYEFYGSTPIFTTSFANTIANNVKINNATTVTLNSTLTINGLLDLTNGLFTTSNTNLPTLTSTASVANASNASFVNGPIKRFGSSAFVFPVGKQFTGYQAIAISAPGSATDAFKAEYMRADPYTAVSSNIGTDLTKISGCEYWLLSREAGSATVGVTLYGNANSGCNTATGANYFTGNGSSLTTLRVAHYNSGTSMWEDIGGSGVGTSPNITVTSSPFSNFSPFTFGSTGINPIPVKLISFTAVAKGNNSLLNWSTATEKNNDHFNIERSTDGINYIKVGEVKGAGNSMNILNYEFTDYTVMNDGHSLFYYRLQQVDYNGDFEFSNVAIVNFAKPNTVNILNANPNPFTNQLALSYELPKAGDVTITMIDGQGRTVESREIKANKGLNNLEFNTAIYATGIYYVTINYNGTVNTSKVIVKN